MIPGMTEYVSEFTSDKAWGAEGYLVEKGLIPMPDQERAQFHLNAIKLVSLSL